MKKVALLTLIAVFSVSITNAQLLKDAKKLLNTGSKTLSEKDAADGIREALIIGTGTSVGLVSVTDGYWGNQEIKIPFPPEARDVESALRAIGMGKKIDDFNLSMNRAAEKAAAEAKPIFVSAITGMTVRDAVDIVKGPDNAATKYLWNNTSVDLKTKFQPVIKNSLDSVNATRYWTDIITTYNKIPLVKKMNPDLSAYVTDKAINGLFLMIAKEEAKIRKDPVARTTELLKKVFGK